MSTSTMFCECSDPGCPECKGDCNRRALSTVYRVDMKDETGTPMCNRCAEDAMDSGVFANEKEAEEDEQEPESEERDWEHSAQFMQEFDPSKGGSGLGEFCDVCGLATCRGCVYPLT